jgi:putative ABC transport system permease protein
MLKRTIENQRGQIGILKAFGYTRKEITLHYMSYALIIGFIGGILGGILGILISFKYTELYNAYFNIPGLKSGFSVTYLFMSIILALVFSLFAGYQGCKGALALEPAEAMRPPSPPLGKKVILEKISFFWNSLNVQGKMALRNMTRHPGRSIFVFLGITFTFSLMGSPWSIWDLTQRMLFDQYEKVEIYDAKISLATPLEQSQIERELMRFPGVKEVESRTEIPVTLKNKWYKKDVILMGLKNDSQLHRILDKDYNRMKIPVKGILLSERLAELLGAKVGTKLTFTSLMAKNPDKQIAIEVTGIVPQYMGLNAYMELEALQSLLEQGHIATSVMLRIDENNLALLQKKYQNSAAILNIDDKNKLLSKSKELMATNSTTIYILLIIGIITGFAIVYNSSIITVSERSRELASMMVLGMTPSEVLSVITFEQWFISIFGMLAGIPMTKLFLIGMANSTSNDVYTMPTTLSNSSIIAAFVVTAACIWVAQRAAAKKIKGLSLVDVLKARE